METNETKALDNTNVEQVKANTSDLIVFGNGDSFQLICKASSKSQGWMKSTKAYDTGNGCIVQVTTEFRDKEGNITNCAEALTFVPYTFIGLDTNGNKKIMPLAYTYPTAVTWTGTQPSYSTNIPSTPNGTING